MKNCGIASSPSALNAKFLGKMLLDLVAWFVRPFPVLPIES